MLDNLLKNMNLILDGKGYAGNVEEINTPNLEAKTEEMRNGGMDAPIDVDMGMNKPVLSFTLSSYDADTLTLFGFRKGGTLPVTVRGALESAIDNTTQGVVINARGNVVKIEKDPFKAGEKAALKVEMSLHYYKETIGNEVVTEIDIPNFKRIIGGIDQLAQQREQLAI